MTDKRYSIDLGYIDKMDKKWCFTIDMESLFYPDPRLFDTKKMCNYASRKWIRDNQNLIYSLIAATETCK